MNIEKIVLGNIDQNCYIIWGPDNKALIIDPGEEKQLIKDTIEQKSLEVIYVINTHGHWDHTGANSISKDLSAKLLIHEADEDIIPDKPDGFLSDGQELAFGQSKAKIYHTPGHTEGSVCLQIGGHLFTGDTLFSGSIGRTDLPGGSTGQMMRTLARLKDCDKSLKVYPGHGPDSTIERELRLNPYMTDTAFLK